MTRTTRGQRVGTPYGVSEGNEYAGLRPFTSPVARVGLAHIAAERVYLWTNGGSTPPELRRM